MSTKDALPYYKIETIVSPAAGANWEIRAPGQGTWRLVSLAARFVASAVAGNRRISLRADDATSVWFSSISTVDIAAAGDVIVGAFPGADSVGSATIGIAIPLPTNGLILMPGWRLIPTVTNLDAGDQWSQVVAMVEEFPMGPHQEWLPTVATRISEMG